MRQIPSIDRLLASPETAELITGFGRTLTTQALQKIVDDRRQHLQRGNNGVSISPEALVSDARMWLEALLAPTLTPAINATGIIIHTNLGRAPLSLAAQQAMVDVAAGYSTLEFDLESGGRGSRSVHSERLLTRLTGAEAALVVNNNAGAVLLMLQALCHGREVVISRGQLVEIGGGFRIPDVMAQSGATLVEVGTTNRTHLKDYEAAIGENTAAILVAHSSNFKIIGFTAQPTLTELAELAHQHDIPLLYDQGGGALVDVTSFGLENEPTIPESIEAGCDLVAFSGDKLLGGPQAGILCGRSELMAQIKRHPLARALRADKSCLAALSATLFPYLTGRAFEEIPVLQMISRSQDDLRTTAEAWLAHLDGEPVDVAIVPGESRVGGGSMPGSSLPTWLLAISPKSSSAADVGTRLRRQSLPIIGRIQDDRLLLDPRTLLPGQEQALLEGLKAALTTDEEQELG